MPHIRSAIARLRAFFSVASQDDDFDQELQSHLALLTDEYVARGMPADDARRRARLRLGAIASLRDQHRDVRGLPRLESVLQDLRFAFRMIAKERALSATIVLTLALGIGANSLGFTVLNAAFFRALPFDGADDIYTLTWRSSNGRRVDVSPTDLDEWRAASRSFESLAAYADDTVSVSDDERPAEEVRATRLTANGFAVLRQQPLLGPGFATDEDQPGATAVVILGFDLWRSRYGSDIGVLGRTIRVNRQPVTVIGVMPDGMRFPDNSQLWMPLSGDITERESRTLTVFGRVASGVRQAQAQAEFTGLAARLLSARPEIDKDLVGINVETFSEAFIGGMGRTLFIVIMVAVTFVLLIACVNVANLLLARSTSRAREIALRLAIGATRRRVTRQLLTESVVLSLIGGIVGLLLADSGIALFAGANAHAGLPYWVVFEMDFTVFGYVAAICVITALLFGLAPAMQVSKANAHTVLRESGRSVLGTPRTRWLTSAMVTVEIALTVVLLGGAGLMFRSFMKLYTVDVGADIGPLLAMQLRLPEETYPNTEARRIFFAAVEERLRTVAGIESFTITTGVPPADGGERLLQVDRPGRQDGPGRFVSTVTISPSFFDVLRRPVLRGRAFTDADGAPGAETVIINERLAAQFFPGEDPIGRRLRFTQRQPQPGQPPDTWRTVVGISAAIHHGSPQDSYVNAVVYIPSRQELPRTASLLVRSQLPAAMVMEAVRQQVREIDRDQPVFSIQSVANLMADDRWVYRVYGGLFTVLALIAVMLSFVGVYAVVSYSVSQRTQEIGVRMAVGARRQQVSWMVLKRGVTQLAVGLPLGLGGALAMGVVIERMLVDLTPADPLTFVAITMILSAVTLGACLIPALRASRVDPMIALRAE